MNDVNDILSRADFASFVERFHAKYARRGADDCWLWTGRRVSRMQYGSVRFGHKGRQRWLAHRIAWVLANGPVPYQEDRLCVLHRCDTPLCVNPAHLFLGTHQDNIADRIAKQRTARGEAAGKSRFTTEQIQAIRKDPRFYTAIAEEHGVSPSSISEIVRGKNWQHVAGAVPVDRAKGVGHRWAKLYPEAVRDIRTRRMGRLAFSRLYGVSVGAVRQVLEGVTWKHVE